jgi:hypothetical protein
MELISGLMLLFLPTIIAGVVVIGSAIWVYKDAKRYEAAGVNIMNPGAWSILVFLLWLPAFPVYLILKFAKYNKQLQQKV